MKIDSISIYTKKSTMVCYLKLTSGSTVTLEARTADMATLFSGWNGSRDIEQIDLEQGGTSIEQIKFI
jgi:hypothetical protein